MRKFVYFVSYAYISGSFKGFGNDEVISKEITSYKQIEKIETEILEKMEEEDPRSSLAVAVLYYQKLRKV